MEFVSSTFLSLFNIELIPGRILLNVIVTLHTLTNIFLSSFRLVVLALISCCWRIVQDSFVWCNSILIYPLNPVYRCCLCILFSLSLKMRNVCLDFVSVVGFIVEVSISICFLFAKFWCEGVRFVDTDNWVEEINFFIWVLTFKFDGDIEFCKEVV